MIKSHHRLLALALLAGAAPLHAQDANQATPVSAIKIKEGFKVELLYSVPKDIQGSWVSMTVDEKGRLITSDQYGSLYRVTPPALGGAASDTKVEKINAKIGHAQGILYHDGAIYLTVNDGAEEFQGRGLYKVTASKGDDQFDTVVQLRAFPNQGGEHGPHAVVLGPDKKSIYCVVGNQTPMTPMDVSRVPYHWAEDQLFPMLLGRGFMRDVLAPGAWTAKTDFEGKKWELLATSCRNTYDADFNHEGDLFTFDADMEWDTSTPWYRPIRVCFMQSGADFGWRTCSKKFPVRWEDSMPPVLDVGLGSPTGVAFGYGTKFPAKYSESFFICDWSYGKLYSVHLKAKGASYSADLEEFMSASPLPLTDLVVSPTDKSLYVTVGGRKTQSGLYRVTYTGKESTEPAPTQMEPEAAKLHALRRSLETFHGHVDPKAVEAAWPQLGHADRNIRFAARIAIEHQPVETWQDKALNETNPRAALTALMALARSTGRYDAQTITDSKSSVPQLSLVRTPGDDKTLQPKILAALNKIDMTSLKGIDKVTLIRDYMLTFTRLGEPDSPTKEALVKRLSPLFPQMDTGLNRDLCELLVYLGDGSVTSKAEPYMDNAPTQEEQIDYARILRFAKTGWTKETRDSYFKWFLHAANYKGGASFNLFLDQIKADAVAGLTDPEKAESKPILEAKPEVKAPSFSPKPMQFVKAWTMDELSKSLGVGLEGNRNFANGRNMFGAATCFACHRFNGEGGSVGPDLTSVSGKFSPRDLLESIIFPSKEISDQYGSTVFTMQDGKQITGRIANMKEDTMMVCTNMMDPNNFTNVNRKKVVKMEESKVSMMPEGLLYMLKEDDILDLLAYLLSQGNPDNPMFKK